MISVVVRVSFRAVVFSPGLEDKLEHLAPDKHPHRIIYVYIYIYIYMYIYIHIHVHVYDLSLSLYLSLSLSLYIYIYTCICVHLFLSPDLEEELEHRVPLHPLQHVRVLARRRCRIGGICIIYICIYIYIYICMHIIYIYICTYIIYLAFVFF